MFSCSSSQIYEAQPEISRAFQTKEFIPVPRLVAMVMVTSVPPVCNKVMFTQALNVSAPLAAGTSSRSPRWPCWRAGLGLVIEPHWGRGCSCQGEAVTACSSSGGRPDPSTP